MEIYSKSKTTQGLPVQASTTSIELYCDFICMELMLIIEVDGITHHWEETIVKDKKEAIRF